MSSHVPFAERPEWAGVVPLRQVESDAAPARIAYSAIYEDTLDMFRAVLASDERSTRALALTTEVIRLNVAFYSAWQHRRRCLEAAAGGADLASELKWADGVVAESAKCYQAWHHRRWLVQHLGASAVPAELSATAAALREDSKNYHAWSHRQWVISQFDATDGELDFAASLIAADVRNNSAWNHRWCIWTRLHGTSGGPADGEMLAELKFVASALQTAFRNESGWNYVRSLLHWASFVPAPAAVVHPAVIITAAGTSECLACSGSAEILARYPYALFPAAAAVEILEPLWAMAADAAEPAANSLSNECAADCAVGRALNALAAAKCHSPGCAHVSSGPATDVASASAASADSHRLLAHASRLLDAAAVADEIRARMWQWRAALVRHLAATLGV